MSRYLADVAIFLLPAIAVVALWLSPFGDRRG